MEQKLTVALPGRAYDIEIARGLLDRAGARCRALLPRAKRLFVLSDTNVAPLYGGRVADSLEAAGFAVRLRVLPAGEGSKSAGNLASLWEEMMAFGMTRTDAVVALGGGVIGDLGGFAAATLLRGVDYIQIPTTLLAQVDSSVGGKVAIDLAAGKNLAGAFWQPRGVLIDPNCLETLPDRDFASGMAEVIKYGCIRDRALFYLLDHCGDRAGVMAFIERIILTCCKLKCEVVLEDERDTGARMTLNFGHTVGHAFELSGGYMRWTHGEAVAAGMVLAARLGIALGVTPAGVDGQIEGILRKFQLPTAIACPWETVEEAVGIDKKRAEDAITLILLSRLGRALPHRMEKEALFAALRPLMEGGAA